VVQDTFEADFEVDANNVPIISQVRDTIDQQVVGSRTRHFLVNDNGLAGSLGVCTFEYVNDVRVIKDVLIEPEIFFIGTFGPTPGTSTELAEVALRLAEARIATAEREAAIAALESARGPQGPPGATLLGTVTVGQIASGAIAAGIREITVPLAEAVAGDRLAVFCGSYKLGTGAVTPGKPPGYQLIDAGCSVAGQVVVALNAPLLTNNDSYELTVAVVRINA